jgi:RNA-binding protein
MPSLDEDDAGWFQCRGQPPCSLGLSAPARKAAPIGQNPTIRPMNLTERQRKYLRGLGHALDPVLLIGNAGLTPAVVAEARRALHDHELIKVKFRGAEREARDAGLAELATATESILLQRIGHTALYYKRRNDRPGIVIPDA